MSSHLSKALCWRHSTDPQEPLDRLIAERNDLGIIGIYEARMTSQSASARVIDYHDKLLLTPEMARWLRDALNAMDLDDHESAGVAPEGC